MGDAETDLWMDNMSEDHKDKFGMATSIQEQHDMDYITHIAEIVKKTTAGGSPRKQIAQSPEEQNSQGEDERVNDSKTEGRPEKRNQKQQIITKFDDTPISVSDKSFAEQIEEQWENPPAPKQSGLYANSQTRQINQTSRRIIIDEFNFDSTEGRNPADWLANALFCLDLEDPGKTMNDGEK